MTKRTPEEIEADRQKLLGRVWEEAGRLAPINKAVTESTDFQQLCRVLWSVWQGIGPDMLAALDGHDDGDPEVYLEGCLDHLDASFRPYLAQLIAAHGYPATLRALSEKCNLG